MVSPAERLRSQFRHYVKMSRSGGYSALYGIAAREAPCPALRESSTLSHRRHWRHACRPCPSIYPMRHAFLMRLNFAASILAKLLIRYLPARA